MTRVVGALALFPLLGLYGCDVATLEECSDVCGKVDECGANPPDAVFGNLGSGSSGSAGVDCAANCIDEENRVFLGYADCQMECIIGAECGAVNDCWNTSSATYAEYCLADRNLPDVAPDSGDPQPGNGSTTGSTDADEIVDDPAVEAAVEEDDFDVNYGDNPPTIGGLYSVSGTIDDAMNARPIGSPIETQICFWDQATLAGGDEVNYCEFGVPGTASAPVIGDGADFTTFLEYPGLATILFSGAVNGDGSIDDAEALVVYLHGIDIWEQSHTSWTPQGDCSGCD